MWEGDDFLKILLLISTSVFLDTEQIQMFWPSLTAWHFLVLVCMRPDPLINYVACV